MSSPPPEHLPVDAPRRSSIAVGYFQGLRTPLEGLRFLVRRPALWHYAMLPLLINIAITLLLFFGLGYACYQFLLYMHTWPAFSTPWWGRIAEFFSAIVVIAATLSLIVASYLLLGGILCGWFNERLARQVELAIGTPASHMIEVPFKYQVIDSLLDFSKVALTAAACFLIGCIPLIGLLGTAISFYIDCFIFGYDYLDYPLALRGMRRREKRAFARKHRPQVLGLGTTVFLMNFIPIFGSVFLTTAAAGAVLLHKRLRDDETTALIHP